jgi:hypothetical protein
MKYGPGKQCCVYEHNKFHIWQYPNGGRKFAVCKKCGTYMQYSYHGYHDFYTSYEDAIIDMIYYNDMREAGQAVLEKAIGDYVSHLAE